MVYQIQAWIIVVRAQNSKDKKMKQTLETLTGKTVAAGIFGADMKISLLNDGPVTIIMDTKDKDSH